jgi:AraC-like DNA-binding protein
MRSAENVAERRRRMVKLLSQLTTVEGMQPSILDGVKLLRSNRSYPRTPVLYEPSIVIIANGRKRGFVGDRCVVYDAHNYLVLAVPLPFECETEASGHEPLLGLSIRVELNTLSELVMKMDLRGQSLAAGDYSSICAIPLDLTLMDTAMRLLECLCLPGDAAILGPGVVREIVYRVLCGRSGGSLLALLSRNSQLAQICRTLQQIHANYAEPLEVTRMAEEAGMSISAFHHNFKAVTATSPLQYVKSIRLHKARMLMVHDGLGAALAADRVGYESPSQFSREFKRYFGQAPTDEAERVRKNLGFDPIPIETALIG